MKPSFHTARSIRYTGLAVMLAAVSAVQACSSDTTPTEPSPVTSEPTAAPATIRVWGIVTDDDGAPLEGVIVSIFRRSTFEQPLSVVSDNAGLYSVSVLAGPGLLVLTTKEGYLSAWHSHSIDGADLQFDLRVYRSPKTAGN